MFERLYSADDRGHQAVDMVQMQGGSYLAMHLARVDGTADSVCNVTKLDKKGDILWSRDYAFDKKLLPTGSLVLLENDSFAFAVLQRASDMAVVVAKAAPDGQLVWSKEVGLQNTTHDVYSFPRMLLAGGPDGNITVFSEMLTSVQSVFQIYGAQLNAAGQLQWANIYASITPVVAITQGFKGITVTADTGFVLCGFSDFINTRDMITMKIDNNGDILWGWKYDTDMTNPFNDSILEVAGSIVEIPGDGFMVQGNYIANTQGNSDMYMKLDNIGVVEWARRIPLTSDTIRSVGNITRTADNAAVIMGNTTVKTFYMLKVFPDGTIDWMQEFQQEHSNYAFDNALFSTMDSGLVAYVTELDPAANSWPLFVKTDNMGVTPCNAIPDPHVFLPVSINTDSLIWGAAAQDTIRDKDIGEMIYTGFNVPVLSLEAPPVYCVGDEIMETFDATIDASATYAWSTGEMIPVITVTEAGMYTVLVTVTEDRCYTLCDTVFISEVDVPTVSIAVFDSTFCTDEQFQVTAVTSGAQFLLWSTGETEAEIITGVGPISVTATNFCGDATAAVNLAPVACPCEVAVPNAFTPGLRDGVNDNFNPVISCAQMTDYNFRVYARWGEMVYESNDRTEAWNGELDGEMLPADVYVWVLEYNNGVEDVQESGDVTLIR